jgi:hypothetical protein
MNQQLYYHKCDDCLTAFSSPEKKIHFCDCNGTVTLMGEVQGNKYIRKEDRSPCDGRCTDACGPMCDCICGGANHGTGRLVQVVVAEGIIKATGLSEEDVNRAILYRGLRDHAEKLYSDKYGQAQQMRGNYQFVERDIYLGMIKARRKLDHAISLRVHGTRINALVAFIKENSTK